MHQYGAGTNVGNVRDNNEDSYVCDDEKELWIVADGMGGLGFGEVASAITTYTVARMVRQGHGINQAIEVAHRNIKEYAESDGLGTNMGTTIVLLLSHGSLYNIFWVGDSRAYLLDDKEMKQITIDHSLVQSLIEQGEITREEAESDPRKNAVTRALGVQELETVRADSISERWQPNQKILLCSDGLTDCVRDNRIEEIMRGDGSDQEIVDELIEAALEGGGNDNITVIVVSAPKTAKTSDSDTHVPDQQTGRGGDDTHIPSNDDDTQSRKQESGQLSLAFGPDNEAQPRQDQATPDALPSAGKTQPVPASIWPRLSVCAAALLCVLVLFSLQFDEPEKVAINENFTITDPAYPPAPPARLPELSFRKSGPTLQVGLFSQLERAETRQIELSSLGLLPHVEKRVSGGEASWAVLLGPLGDDSHRQAVRTLEDHSLAYFRTPEAG